MEELCKCCCQRLCPVSLFFLFTTSCAMVHLPPHRETGTCQLGTSYGASGESFSALWWLFALSSSWEAYMVTICCFGLPSTFALFSGSRVSTFFFFKKNILLLFYYSCPHFFAFLHLVLPTTLTVIPHPVVHVHGSFIHVPWLVPSPEYLLSSGGNPSLIPSPHDLSGLIPPPSCRVSMWLGLAQSVCALFWLGTVTWHMLGQWIQFWEFCWNYWGRGVLGLGHGEDVGL